MSLEEQRVCVGCGDNEDVARLDRCGVCSRDFCLDCSHRALGRRFCSAECSRAYFYYGDSDDDEDAPDSE